MDTPSGVDDATLQEMKELKSRLRQWEDIRATGWYKRAKVKWAAFGDLPNKYFFNRLKQQKKHNVFSALSDEQGIPQETQDSLPKLIKRYYADFLKAEERPDDWQEKWESFQVLLEKVTEGQNKYLEKDFSAGKLEAALKAMPNGKAPGRDSFNKEFML